MVNKKPKWQVRAAQWLGARVFAFAFTIVSIAAIVYLAVRSTQKFQPSASEAAFVTLFATVTSLFGTAFFARIGRADPRQARSAVRRLLEIGLPLGKRLQRMDPLMGGGKDAEFIAEARSLAIEVEGALRGLQGSIAEWNSIHRYTLHEVMEEQAEIRAAMEPQE
jgi:hypothetical protein